MTNPEVPSSAAAGDSPIDSAGEPKSALERPRELTSRNRARGPLAQPLASACCSELAFGREEPTGSIGVADAPSAAGCAGKSRELIIPHRRNGLLAGPGGPLPVLGAPDLQVRKAIPVLGTPDLQVRNAIPVLGTPDLQVRNAVPVLGTRICGSETPFPSSERLFPVQEWRSEIRNSVPIEEIQARCKKAPLLGGDD
jgi:hypothetical protein